MGDYVEEGLSKSHQTDESASAALAPRDGAGSSELRHGAWIQKAQAQLKVNPFSNAKFALLTVFLVLYVGSVFLFESMDIISGPLYAIKITISSLFAVSLGVILSLWWQSTARFDEKIREAERLDAEYRELLLSFSDSLFDIINALNTLAVKPPRPFAVATEFMLGEYVHLLQSQLQRYGDYVAALGLDASAFLDEKITIFEGIRERASSLDSRHAQGHWRPLRPQPESLGRPPQGRRGASSAGEAGQAPGAWLAGAPARPGPRRMTLARLPARACPRRSCSVTGCPAHRRKALAQRSPPRASRLAQPREANGRRFFERAGSVRSAGRDRAPRRS